MVGKRKSKRRRWIRPEDNKILLALLVLVLTVQFGVLCWFNLTQMPAHMGFDSSWAYLRTVLMWNNKTVYSPDWAETSNLFTDTPALPAAILYGLTKNVFLSYGIVNILVLCGILFCVYSIFRKLEFSRTGALVSMNLLLCPFLMNGFSLTIDLGYFSNMLADAAFYSVRVLTMLLIVRAFVVFRTANRVDFWGILAAPLCLLAGISTGFYLILVLLVPYLAFLLESALIERSWKPLIRKEAIYGYALICFVIAGRFVSTNLFGFLSLDAHRTWTPISGIWNNYGAVVQGFLKLITALPVLETDEVIIAFPNLLRIFPLCILFVICVSLLVSVKTVRKDWFREHGFLLLLLNILAINFLMFGLFNVQYGTALFEERYLITSFVLLVLLVGWLVHTLSGKRMATWMICGVLLVSVAGVDAFSDQVYLENRNDVELMEQIRETAEREDAGMVCFWGGETRILSKNMRVYDLKRVYKSLNDDCDGYFHGGGDYRLYDSQEEYSGPVLFIRNREDDTAPEWAEEVFDYVGEFDDFVVYRCDHNPFDL